MDYKRIVCIVCAALIYLSGCSTESAREVGRVQELNGTIIFVPGFKSSVLSRDDGSVLWITAQQALFGSSSLTLPSEEMGLKNVTLHDGGILGRVSILPFLYGFDVNDGFLAKLRKDFPRYRILAFHYDWRRDNIEAIRSLSALIDQERQSGARSVHLIGHSMGGLIVAYYLRYGAADFPAAVENWHGARRVDSVVLGGTPFRGSQRMFHDMQLGSTIIFNSRLLSSEALSSFPSSYQLLPRFPDGISTPQSLDIEEVENWTSYEWGLFREKTKLSKSFLAARTRFVAENLKRASQFSGLLHAPVSESGPRPPRLKLLNVFGSGLETMSKIQWAGAPSTVDFDALTTENGDGSVLVESAALPEAEIKCFDTRSVEVQAEHGRVLSGEPGYEELVRFLSQSGS